MKGARAFCIDKLLNCDTGNRSERGCTECQNKVKQCINLSDVTLESFEMQEGHSLSWTGRLIGSCWGLCIVSRFLDGFLGSGQQMKSEKTTC